MRGRHRDFLLSTRTNALCCLKVNINSDFVLREDRENKEGRVHKNSMEEWEERLQGKQPEKLSAVERIIENAELRNRAGSRQSPVSCRSTARLQQANSPCLTRLRRLEQFKHKRPKSLDLSDGRDEASKKFHFFSKENISFTRTELSELDNEVENITRKIGCSSKNICNLYRNILLCCTDLVTVLNMHVYF